MAGGVEERTYPINPKVALDDSLGYGMVMRLYQTADYQ